MSVRVIVEVDEGHVDLRMEFNDNFAPTGSSATKRVLACTAIAESATIAALNTPPREPREAVSA